MHVKYHCDFCPKCLATGFDSAVNAEIHEAGCQDNPANRTCATCKHLEHTPEYRGQKRPWRCAVLGDRKFREYCKKWEGKKGKRGEVGR